MPPDPKTKDWIESTLPYYLVSCTTHRFGKTGFPLLAEMENTFHNAVIECLNLVPHPFSSIALLTELSDVANEICDMRCPGDPRDMLLAVLWFPTLLTDNGLWQSPLVPTYTDLKARLIALDLWKPYEKWIEDATKVMLHRARLMGYYWEPNRNEGYEQ